MSVDEQIAQLKTEPINRNASFNLLRHDPTHEGLKLQLALQTEGWSRDALIQKTKSDTYNSLISNGYEPLK